MGSHLESYAIDLQDFLNKIHQKKLFVSISLFDCSRFYYFRNEHWKRADEEISPHGLTLVRPEINSLIVLPCLPNEITNNNSLFTKTLCKYLQIPNKDIRMILSEITNEIVQISNPKQIPYVISTLTHQFICLFQRKIIPSKMSIFQIESIFSFSFIRLH